VWSAALPGVFLELGAVLAWRECSSLQGGGGGGSLACCIVWEPQVLASGAGVWGRTPGVRAAARATRRLLLLLLLRI
jgi:hypothetical protein